MSPLEISLKTITPLWTGGPNGQADRLHMTGIMGSLRWWYEVLVRSVGGNVCEPGQHSCLYDPDELDDDLCDVCRVFGATGWARRFRLVVSEDNLHHLKPAASRINTSGQRVFSLSRDYPTGHNWYLNGDPLSGQVTLKIIPTGSMDKEGNKAFDPALIAGLIQLIAGRASLGAKPQMGLGVVQVINRQSTQSLLDHLKQIMSKHLKTDIDDKLPCLQNMFFARVDVGSTSESSTFDLKYDLRNMLREKFKGQNELRHVLMGYVERENRSGAKIMMSYPYGNGTVRIWGWIPGLAHSKPSLDNLLTEIYYHLTDIYEEDNVPFWLDFDSQKNSGLLEYIKNELLVGAE